MGAHSEDPHLCWASRLLGFSSLVLSAFSTVVNGSGTLGSQVEDSGNTVSLTGTQGGSVSFHVTRSPELAPGLKLEKISWAIKSGRNYTIMLHVSPGEDVPKWVNFQDKFEKRVHVLNTTTLRIDNLTLEDSGHYWARVSLTGGRERNRYFHLTVYEPVPRPRILAQTQSITPDWCNVTLECHTPGTREDVNVSWESKGLPRELEQRGVPGPAPNPWTLALKLPLSQPSPSITCVVSNPGDRKTATRDLGEVCAHGPHGPDGSARLPDILATVGVNVGLIVGALVVVLLVIGVTVRIWLMCERGRIRIERFRLCCWHQRRRTRDRRRQR
ncbi:CD48 antigen-like isoform X1 [Panthera onca]